MRDIKLSDLVKKEKDLYKCRWLGFDGVDQDIELIDNTKDYVRYKNGEDVYFENSEGAWSKRKYRDGEEIYLKISNGYWEQKKYKDNNQTYYENSSGYWWKRKYENEKEIYFEEGKYCIDREQQLV